MILTVLLSIAQRTAGGTTIRSKHKHLMLQERNLDPLELCLLQLDLFIPQTEGIKGYHLRRVFDRLANPPCLACNDQLSNTPTPNFTVYTGDVLF